MKNQKLESDRAESTAVRHCCNHPPSVIVNPSERELREFEAMLASCPNCSRWSPGDGPIMAVLSTETSGSNDEIKGFSQLTHSVRIEATVPDSKRKHSE